MGDELVVAGIFAHDVRLPGQVATHLVSSEVIESRAQGRVDGPGQVGKVFPGVDPVGPVVQPVGCIETIQVIIKPLPQVLDEEALHVGRYAVVVLGLIVDLVANHLGVIGHMAHQPADDALAIISVGGVDDVHDLTCAISVGPLGSVRQNIRVHGNQPGGHGIGGCAYDNLKAEAPRGIQHPVHMAEVENTGLWFQGAPCGFSDTNSGDACSLHHRHVPVNPLIGHVLVIVGASEDEAVRKARIASRS